MKPESKERTEKWAAAKQPGQGLPRNIPHPWRGPLNGCSEGRQNLLQSTDCCMPPAPPLSNGSIYQPVTSHHCTLHMRDTNHLSISFINLWIKKSNIKKKKSNTDYYASSPGKATHPHHIPASLKRSWTSNELWLDGTLRGGGLSLGETCVYFTSEGDWVDYLVTKRMVLCIKYFQLSPWHRQCCASWPCVVMRDMTSSGHHYVVK